MNKGISVMFSLHKCWQIRCARAYLRGELALSHSIQVKSSIPSNQTHTLPGGNLFLVKNKQIGAKRRPISPPLCLPPTLDVVYVCSYFPVSRHPLSLQCRDSITQPPIQLGEWGEQGPKVSSLNAKIDKMLHKQTGEITHHCYGLAGSGQWPPHGRTGPLNKHPL